MFSLRLEPATGRVAYVDAGHGLAAIVRRSGAVQQLASHAPPLGALADSRWRQQYAELGPGDTLITVSDGWLEFFDTVESAAAEAVRVVLESSSAQQVVNQMGHFGVGQVLVDDLTVVVVRRSL
jgi:serine phosphatase RsbU (regulator of sigma subunit)